MLRDNGLDAMLKTKNGDYSPNWSTENSFEISVDVAAPPASPEAVTEAVASLRHQCLSAPLSMAFSELASGEPSMPAFHYRFGSAGKFTPTFVVPSKDRVVVVYVMSFEDKTDRQIARVFLQEFAGTFSSFVFFYLLFSSLLFSSLLASLDLLCVVLWHLLLPLPSVFSCGDREEATGPKLTNARRFPRSLPMPCSHLCPLFCVMFLRPQMS